MKWALLLCVATAGCQQGTTPTPDEAPATGSDTQVISLPKATVTDAYKTDIANLCDAVHASGADQRPKDERWPIIAMWLGPHITTDDGREYLFAIQPLRGQAKVLALETEARRVGIGKCALADEWRAPN
jgi:hypothetical protein